MGTLETQATTDTALTRIAWLSSQDRHRTFHSLMHHINVDSLRACCRTLSGRKATGVDGITKADYEVHLEAKLEDLITRMKRMAYRPGPVRQVLIPKEGKRGAKRPLGISNFEDKLVQKRIQEILESIYDPIFLDCSYGFRANRNCHDAIKALSDHLHRHEVETVIDVDLANYFGSIDHDLLTEMLQQKIKDPRFIRYIRRLFKAGVLTDGEFRMSEEGVPQGSCCSPVLANIFAHYVLDEWFNDVVIHHVKGSVKMIRYADDLVILCRYKTDAERIRKALGKRLAKYKLTLHEEKTQLVSFSKRGYARGEKQGSFDFLGFTFYLGRSRRGAPLAKLKTNGKRLRSKLKKVNQWARQSRNAMPLKELWKRFRAVVRGHLQYYGVSHNCAALNKYSLQAKRIMFKWLNRRSQKKSMNWEQYQRWLASHPLPKVQVYHRLF